MDDPRFNDDLAPEAHNSEQDDEGAQAQTVADEALRGGGETLSDSEKVRGGDPGDGTPDLVDHMNQMASSGRIALSPKPPIPFVLSLSKDCPSLRAFHTTAR